MFDSMEIRDEIDSAIESADDKLRADGLHNLRSLVIADLRDGPIYLDDDGESVSCFDDGARRFDFGAACQTLSDWADSNIADISMESAYDDETGESEYESIDGTREQIITAIFGADLASYL